MPNYIRSILAIAVVLLLFSCKEEAEQTQVQFPENQEMAELVFKIASEVNPYNITYYYNERRAQFHLNNTRFLTGDDYLSSLFWYGREMLNAGHTEDAIRFVNSILDGSYALKTPLTAEFRVFFRRLLGVCYLRLGEQTNCLLNHTSESCLLPIAGDGLHLDKTGSEMAIQIFEEILKDSPLENGYPEDLEIVWLLNIAYQTIGQYPEQVPEAYRIPPAVFTDSGKLKGFADVAVGAMVATREIAGGSAIVDLDLDGLPDLVTSSSGVRPSDQLIIYKNLGNGKFEDVTKKAGLIGITGGLNLNITDYNNDGFPDIYLMRGGWFGEHGRYPNSLLRNNGDGTFTDVTKAAGVLDFSPGQTSVWADFNSDGFLDLFIGFESIPNTTRENNHPSRLYINNGDGSFRQIPGNAGINVNAFVKGVVAGDINNDGRPDLYISTLNGRNYLYVNGGGYQDADWKFTEIAEQAGVLEPIDGFAAMFLDVNNDGFEDLFVMNYKTTPKNLSYDIAAEALGMPTGRAHPYLYINNGDNTFTNRGAEYGLATTLYGMGLNFGDLDNDGWLDFYVGTGNPSFEGLIPNRMFRNVEGKRFEEVTYTGGFSNVQKGHGISWGDIDNDGDHDIYVNMGGAHEGDVYQNLLFENPGFGNHFLNIRLEGSSVNRLGVGARIRLKIRTAEGTRELYRVAGTGASFGSNDIRVHIGLGRAEKIEELEIVWPGKKAETTLLYNVPLSEFIHLQEGREGFTLQNPKTFRFSRTPGMLHGAAHQ